MRIRERLQRELSFQLRLDTQREQEGFQAARVYLEKVVLEHGQEYTGIERPKGFRHQRVRKQCFMNAAVAAMRGQATYVEGYAMSCRTYGLPSLHAWLTVDGVHAIDQTLPDALATEYLGIPFPTVVLCRALDVRCRYGILDLLIEQPEIEFEILGLSPASAQQ